tara:strand:+ start:3496 stop:5199 length:1704 start_codon:yes stop_codon:yes gene_type:complete
MFDFIHGAWAFFIIPILGMLYYFRLKDRSRLWQVFQSEKNWRTSIRLSDSGNYFWQKILVLFALFFIVVALMRPQYGEHFETIEREGRQVFFIMDTSLSMLAEDGAKTRLDLAKYHIQQLLPKLTDDFMSIVPYANTAYTYLPLTTDMSAVDLFLDDMFVGMIGSSGSNITNALKVVKESVKKNSISQSATLIIFSDGEFSPKIDQKEIDDLFRGINISSVVVGLGRLQGEPIPQRGENNDIIGYKKDQNGNIVLSKRIDEQLERLAESLNGIVINGDVSPLVAEKIYLVLSKIETQQLEEKQLVTKIDRYHWVLLMALLCLMVEYILPRVKIKYAKSIIAMALIMVVSHPVNASHPGVSAYNDQNFQKAESEFKLALNKRPDNGKVIYNLGNTYYKLGDHDKSIKAYQEAIDNLSEKEKIEAYYNLGTAHLKKNDMKKALEAYKEVLRRNPHHIKTKQNIEIALRKKQQKQQQQQQNSSERNNDNSQEETAQNNEENSNEDSEEQSTASRPADETQEGLDKQENNNNKSKKELSEQQIQYLVDNAEKEAREKQQKKQTKLFEEAEW